MVRRIAGLASCILLLRLNVVAVDTTCGQHDAASAHTEQAQTHDHPLTVAHDPESHAVEDESCDRPVRADCCRALASCAFTLDFGGVTRHDAQFATGAERGALGSDLPSSYSTAPDPPPPKA